MKTRRNSISTHIAATRALAAQGLTVDQIAQELGKSPSTIADYAATYGIAIVRPAAEAAKERRDTIRALATEGLSTPEIAAAMGMSEHNVRALAQRAGIVIRALTTIERARRLSRGSGGLIKGAIRVPKWVHPSLRSEYRDFTADLGEDEAARRIRRLQHDMHGGQAA